MKTVDVEWLVEWTYRLQKADLVIDRGVGLHDIEARAAGITRSECTSLVAVEKYATLGCFVDGGGYASGAVHEDAEAVHEAVKAMRHPVPLLLRKHGKKGDRPGWGEELRVVFRPIWKREPRYDHEGKPLPKSFEMIYRSNRPVYCPVRRIDHTGISTRLRSDYIHWHAGLSALVERFKDNPLTAHEVIGPAAPARPWLDG